MRSSTIPCGAGDHASLEQGKEIEPEDVEAAIKNYRSVYEFLIEEDTAP